MRQCLLLARLVRVASLALPLLANAQDAALPVVHFGVQEGFTSGGVLAIQQDRFGFLWIGTMNGLYQYEGYAFTHFLHDPNVRFSLSSPMVQALYEDEAGDLWVGTENGLNRFDRSLQRFERYLYDPQHAVRADENSIDGIEEYPRGTLWLGTDGGGLLRLDRETGLFTRYVHDTTDAQSLPDNDINVLYKDWQSRLWIGTNGGGLARLDAASDTFIVYKPDPAKGLSSGSISALYASEDASDVLWIGTAGGGLNRLDIRTETFTVYRPDPAESRSIGSDYIPSDYILAIYPDEDDHLWVATDRGGLERFDPVTGTFNPVALYVGSTPYDHGVWSIFRDRAGTSWFGTQNGGLLKADPVLRLFPQQKVHAPASQEPVKEIEAIYADADSVVWLGSWVEGLLRLDRKTGSIVQYRHDPNDATSLSSNAVGPILRDRAGTLWVGTAEGLNRMDAEAGRFRRFRYDPVDSTRLDCIMDLTEDPSGRLWVGHFCGLGLSLFDPATGRVRSYRHKQDTFYVHGKNQVRDVLVDRSGIVWTATDFGGLNRFDPATEQFSSYTESTYFMSLSSLVEDQDGRLWVGSYGGGLHLFDRDTRERTLFSLPEGLPENHVTGMLEDDQGALWVTTEWGLSRFDLERRVFKNYDASNGFESPIYGVSTTKSASGELFFTGREGFYAFYPDQKTGNTHPPQIALTDFRLFNRPMVPNADSPLQQHISVTENLQLKHWQNDVAFEFVALHFSDPGKNQYAYMLDGYDSGWVQAGTQRTATYTNLDPGRYTFRVKAANADGIWNEEGTSLQLVILPPWWSTVWFRLLVLLMLGSLVAAAYRLRIRYLFALERTRARIADDLHDDIGSRMSSIALMIEVTSHTATLGAAEEARLYEAAVMARQLVGDLRDTVWIIDAGHDTLADLLGRMQQAASQLLHGLRHRLVFPEEVPDVALALDVRRNLLMIVKEALHNAVRHAQASRVEVEVSLESGVLRIQVRDDGRGFDPEVVEMGRGLRTMRERAAAVGGRLAVASTPGQGTRVALDAEIM